MQRAFHTVSAARKHLHQAPLLETFFLPWKNI